MRHSHVKTRSQSPQWSPISISTRDCDAAVLRRSVPSSLELGLRSRLCIQYENKELRTRSEENLRRLFVEAREPTNSSNNAKLVKKALQYRGILGRVGIVNPQDPGFDASKALGVTWVRYQLN